MAHSNRKSVRIASESSDKKTLSAAQKQFNSLIKKIDQQKKILLEWKETVPLCQQQVEQEYQPLEQTLNDYKAQWVQLLDRLYDMPLFKKTDKLKIKYLICEVSEHLISACKMEELKPLFDKYSDEDYDTINQEADYAVGDIMKSIAENMFNVDLGDDVDISSPEKFHAHLQEKLREQEQAKPTSAKPRKKTKKQLEKEARQQEEEALASKSVQEVYRKLVGALHPDREQDEQERERKTELMQRVNIAYGKKDLLQLLELQLEVEQIDPEHLKQIADSRLKYFNKVLKEQLAELEQENGQIEDMFKMNLNMPFYMRLSPKQLMLTLKNDIRALQSEIKDIQKELETFQNPAAFKAWLKNYKLPKKSSHDDLDDLFGGMMPFGF